MKTPRINDFDPDVKVPTLKSPLDGMPTIGKPQQKIKPTSPTSLPGKSVVQEEQANQPTPVRANARTPVRPNGKRIITRNAFEIYEDQMDTLRKLSMEEKMGGKLGSMSAMVREAIDNYLPKKVLWKITQVLTITRTPDRPYARTFARTSARSHGTIQYLKNMLCSGS